MKNELLKEVERAGFRSKNINGVEYTLKVLPATAGLKVGNALIKAAAPLLGLIVDSSKKDLEFAADDNTATMLAMTLVEQMDNLDVVDLIKLLVSGVSANGTQIDFETHFAGQYGVLIALVEFSLVENFGNFFSTYLKAKGLETLSLTDLMKSKLGGMNTK